MSKQIIDFWAPWCRPCGRMAPVIQRLIAERPDLDIQLVNVDETPRAAAERQVGSVPTLIFIQDGTEVHRTTGAMTFAALSKAVDEAFGGIK